MADVQYWTAQGQRSLSERDWYVTDPPPVLGNETLSFRAVAVATMPSLRRHYQPWLPEAMQRLRQVAEMPANWDDEGAIPPQPDAATEAAQILVATAFTSAPAPFIFATTEGGIALEWHRDTLDLRVDIEPNDTQLIYYSDRLINMEWEGKLGFEPVSLSTLLAIAGQR